MSVATTLIAGVLTLFVATQPASANHLTRTLQASPELASGGTGSAITVTATLSSAADVTSGPIEIDAEIEGGPADSATDTNGADDPDTGCTVAQGDSSCSFTVTSSTSGTSLVRLWIDHDKKDAVGEGGVTEADLTEARLANTALDLDPTAGYPSPEHADCRQPEDFPALRADLATDGGCSDDTADDGARNEGSLDGADNTDVIQLTWNTVPNRLDCDWTANNADVVVISPPSGSATVKCKVLDTSGVPASGVYIDAENLSSEDGTINGDGANDPDDGATDPADYGEGEDDFGSSIADEPACHTGTDGTCTFDIAPVHSESGPAVICFWIDKKLAANAADDEDNFDPGAAPSDGGDCDNELVGETENNDVTDSLKVRWSNTAAVASIVDLTPETGSANTGGALDVLAQVRDQFGDPFPTETTVNFEITDPSPSDTDGNTPESPDKTCKTNSSGQCGFQLSSAAAGTDYVCGWIGAAPAVTNTTCGGETAADGSNVDRIDVVTRTWTVQSSGGDTSGGGGSNPQADPDSQGYVLVGGDGGIFNFGIAQYKGSLGAKKLNAPIIGIAYIPGGSGYWLVAKDGGVFTFGDAKFWGSMGDKKLNGAVLGMESTPSGNGYWLFAEDGGIFSFGDAKFYGSMGDKTLNAPVVGMAVNEMGDGYWLVAKDGGVFTFNTPYYGSMGGQKINQPVFDMATAAGDKGYWLIARDGGVFTFGSAQYYGSGANAGLATVIGMSETPTGNGYWVADQNGKVVPFGDALFLGDRSRNANNAPMVAFAAVQPKP